MSVVKTVITPEMLARGVGVLRRFDSFFSLSPTLEELVVSEIYMSVAQTRRASKRIRKQYGTPYKGKTLSEKRELKKVKK